MDLSTLEDPDVRVAGLSLWIRGRERPDATDYWDGNWLQTLACCRYPGADVWTEGPFLRTDELERFVAECGELSRMLTGQAALDCVEPNLKVRLVGGSQGHIAVFIALTPEDLRQRHEFKDDIDQSYLPAIQSACKRVLSRFPVIGRP